MKELKEYKGIKGKIIALPSGSDATKTFTAGAIRNKK